MNNTSEIFSHPVTGILGAVTGTIAPFIEAITESAQMVAAVIGAGVVILNLFLTIRKLRKK
mgnify:CR=1 FL=1